jgi:hypothetical protein
MTTRATHNKWPLSGPLGADSEGPSTTDDLLSAGPRRVTSAYRYTLVFVRLAFLLVPFLLSVYHLPCASAAARGPGTQPTEQCSVGGDAMEVRHQQDLAEWVAEPLR